MGSYYADSKDVRVLHERVEELARIRQGFATHLGSSLYEATKDNPELRWGRESLYDGISACDSERERLLVRIQELGGEPESGETVAPDPASEFDSAPESKPEVEPEAAPEPEPEPADAFAPIPAPDFAPAPEPISAPDLVDAFDPAVESDVVPEPSVDISSEPEPEPSPEPEAAATSKLDLDKTVVKSAISEPANDGTKCPSCGASVRPGDLFCMTCGSKISSAQPKPTNVCPHCGSPTEPGFKFCMTCGKSLT